MVVTGSRVGRLSQGASSMCVGIMQAEAMVVEAVVVISQPITISVDEVQLEEPASPSLKMVHVTKVLVIELAVHSVVVAVVRVDIVCVVD